MTPRQKRSESEPARKSTQGEPPIARVKDIMTPDVVVVEGDAIIPHIAQLMHDNSISAIPVVDQARRVIGMVTDLDLIVRNTRIKPPAFFPILDGRIPLETPSHFKKRMQHMVGATARDVMTEEVLTVGPDEDIEALAELMVKRRVNAVPVVTDGRLVGVVARADVIRWMTRDVEGPIPAQGS